MPDKAQLAMQPVAAGANGQHYKLGKHSFDVFIYPGTTVGQNAKIAVVLNVDTVKSPPGGSAPPPGTVPGVIMGNMNAATGEFTINTNNQNLVATIQNLNSGGQPSTIRIELELPGAAIPAPAVP
jgi:hypothetical protein